MGPSWNQKVTRCVPIFGPFCSLHFRTQRGQPLPMFKPLWSFAIGPTDLETKTSEILSWNKSFPLSGCFPQGMFLQLQMSLFDRQLLLSDRLLLCLDCKAKNMGNKCVSLLPCPPSLLPFFPPFLLSSFLQARSCYVGHADLDFLVFLSLPSNCGVTDVCHHTELRLYILKSAEMDC